jgi:hypothetical protein
VSGRDAVFEPLLGKRRTTRQALVEVAERWGQSPIEDAVGRSALEDAVRHKLLRGQIGGEVPAGADAAALARAFVGALVAGEGGTAVARVFPIR